MNCPICGANAPLFLCKNCEANNDKITSWYSTFKSNVLAKETKISLYLSKFTIEGEGYIGIEKVYDSEGDHTHNKPKKVVTQVAHKSGCEPFEFALVHVVDVTTSRFNGQQGLLIKITQKVDHFIEDISLYLPGLPNADEIAGIVKLTAEEAKERSLVKKQEYELIKAKEDAEFFLKKYNEYIEKADFPSFNVKLDDNNLKGFYLDRDKNLVFLDICGVERMVHTAYIPFENINYYREISSHPKVYKEKKGYFGGRFLETDFDIDRALHDYVLLNLPGRVSTHVPVLPDVEHTFPLITEANHADAGNMVINFYNPKLRENFELELPFRAYNYFQQFYPELDLVYLDEEETTRQAIADLEAAEAKAILDAEKEKALKEAEEIKQLAAKTKAAALKEAQEAQEAFRKAEETKFAAFKEAQAAKSAALREAQEAKEAALAEAAQAKEAAIREAELAREQALKETEQIKEKALKEAKAAAFKEAEEAAQAHAEEAKAAALAEAEEAKAAVLAEVQAARDAALREAEEAKALALKEAEEARNAALAEAEEAKAAALAEAERLRREAQQAIEEAERAKAIALAEAKAAREAVEITQAEQVAFSAKTNEMRITFTENMAFLEAAIEAERLEREELARIEEQRLEEERQRKLEEEQRLEEERQRQLEEERQRKLEEEQRLEEERQRKLEEERRLEEERQRKLEEEQRLEEERQRKLEEERRLEEERQRKLEEERRLEEERQRKLEEEQRLEEERQRQLEYEEEQKRILEEQRLRKQAEAEEQARLEAEKLAAIQAQLQAQKEAQEQARLAEEERQRKLAEELMEEQRLRELEEQKALEQTRLEEERLAREEQKLRELEEQRALEKAREAAVAAAQDALADAKAEREALIQEAHEEAEQTIKKSKFSLKTDAEKAAELENLAKELELEAEQNAQTERRSSLTLAAEDNYLNYEHAADNDVYMPTGDGITGYKEDSDFEGSLLTGTEEEPTLHATQETEPAPAGADDENDTLELSEFEIKISKLKIMLAHDLITEEEFEQRKNELFKNF